MTSVELLAATVRAAIAALIWMVFAPALADVVAPHLTSTWNAVVEMLAGPELRTLSVGVISGESPLIAVQFVTQSAVVGTVTVPAGIGITATLPAMQMVQPLFPIAVIVAIWPGMTASRRTLAFAVGTVLAVTVALLDTPLALLGSTYMLLFPADDIARGSRALVEWLFLALNMGGRMAAGALIGFVSAWICSVGFFLPRSDIQSFMSVKSALALGPAAKF